MGPATAPPRYGEPTSARVYRPPDLAGPPNQLGRSMTTAAKWILEASPSWRKLSDGVQAQRHPSLCLPLAAVTKRMTTSTVSASSQGAFTIRNIGRSCSQRGPHEATGLSDRELGDRQSSSFSASDEVRPSPSVLLGAPCAGVANVHYALVTIFSALSRRPPLPSENWPMAPHPISRRFGDSVAAYGLPVEEMTCEMIALFLPLSMKNQRASEKIDRLCHALALDDERTTFHPLLWDESEEAKVFHGQNN